MQFRASPVFILTAAWFFSTAGINVVEARRTAAPERIRIPDEAVYQWELEYAGLRHEIDARSSKEALPKKTRSASHVLDPHSRIRETDKSPLDVVLRRTRALLNDIKQMPDAPDLSDLEQQLVQLESSGQDPGLSKVSAAGSGDTFLLFKTARSLQRQIALANPVLDGIDEIIFIKGTGHWGLLHTAPWGETAQITGRTWTKEDWHNFNFDVPRGEGPPDGVKRPGLYVLSGFKTGTPETRPLFMDSKLENGANAGNVLVEYPGEYQFGFDLSYDGQSVVFAKRLGNDAPYHLFKGNIDGTNLQQLTSSWFPDWEPCFLPSGRIAFISLRRWIAARCQSWIPQACGTLFSMKADGTDLFPISWHETSEFHPTVDNDGMLVFTRWDYVDRDFSAAHHIWISFPDGRDPRAPHGNYPQPHSTQDLTTNAPDGRAQRPWAEFHIRAIPNTWAKYVAIACDHHGSGPGVPVVINTAIEDDNAMSQVKIVKGNCMPSEQPNQNSCPDAHYLTPWPLSEDYFLVTDHRQGIVLMDKFGNTELLMAGEGLGPRPLMARKIPPVIPTATWQGEREGQQDHRRAVISIMNIYISDIPWPEGTEIDAIRIIQVVPKPWSSSQEHRWTAGFSAGGMPRMILGTVPVEEDGSAYFEAPVEREILFQALDKNGMAVQSMRSGTYVHPGEHLSCVGCHESKWEAPVPGSPLAMQRPPSKITPEVSGAAPFSFARLAQPALERSCVSCHLQTGKSFTGAYYGQMKDYAFWFDGDDFDRGLWPVHGGYRTLPGRFGAMESRMGKAMLNADHQAAVASGEISDEDFHRIVLWLDANSMELGAFNDDDAQRAGQVVWPILESDSANPTGVEHDRPLTAVRTVPHSNAATAPGSLQMAVSGHVCTVYNHGLPGFKLTLFDLSGRAVFSTENQKGSGQTRMDLGNHTIGKGTYVIRVSAIESAERLSRKIALIR